MYDIIYPLYITNALHAYTGRPKKKVTVLEAAHSHVFNDRLFKFSGVVPDITRFCYMTLLLMSDGWSLSWILSNENALIQKSAQIVDKSNHLFVCFCIDLYGWYSSVLQLNPNPTFIAIILVHSIWYSDHWWENDTLVKRSRLTD